MSRTSPANTTNPLIEIHTQDISNSYQIVRQQILESERKKALKKIILDRRSVINEAKENNQLTSNTHGILIELAPSRLESIEILSVDNLVRALGVLLFVGLLGTMIAINDVQTSVNTLVQLQGSLLTRLAPNGIKNTKKGKRLSESELNLFES